MKRKMPSAYKEKILREIEKVPEDKMPKLLRIIHLLTTETTPKKKKPGNRGSLKGIWKGSQIDESLFNEAKKSLFPYETALAFWALSFTGSPTGKECAGSSDVRPASDCRGVPSD